MRRFRGSSVSNTIGRPTTQVQIFPTGFGPSVSGREDQLNVACRGIDRRPDVGQRLPTVTGELATAT